MIDAVTDIAVDDIRPSCRNEPVLIERIKKAFAKAQDFWMSTDDALRFRAALAAILLETSDEAEKRRILETNDYIKALNAMMSGLDVNMPDISDPLPLIGMWHDARMRK